MLSSWRHIALAPLTAAAALAAVWLVVSNVPSAAADPGTSTGGTPSLPLLPPGGDPGGGGGPSGGGGVDPAGGSGVPPPPPPFPPGSFEAGGGGGGGGGNFGAPSAPAPNFEIPGQLLTDLPVGPNVSPDQLVAVFPGTLPRSVGAAFAADHDSTVVDYFQLARLNAHVFLLAVRDTARFGQVFDEMVQDRRPLWVQKNPAFATSPARRLSSTDPKPNIGLQYALTQLHFEPVLEVTRATGVPVAMVDSGVAVTHEALADANIAVLDVISKPNTLVTTATPEVHGTAIASIIVGHGTLQGVAPEVKLLAIRAFRETDSKSGAALSNAFYLSKGISAAIDRGARIINLSLTGPQDRLVAHTVEQALMAKIAVIAAAGNAGPGAPPAYPAAQAGVIAVTATDSVDHLYRYANRGPYVTVAAPGVDILVAQPKGYGYLSGTSMATAFVSGLSALMISRANDLTPTQLRKLLEMTATDLGQPQRDPEFGAGRIDATAAFTHLAAH
jgi:subtilisin family serine protease